MSNQTPIVAIGTEFAAGKVVAIKYNTVLLETPEGVKEFSFSQVEIDFACAGDLIEIASMFGWEYEMGRPDEFTLQPEE